MSADQSSTSSHFARIGLLAGPLAALLVHALLPDAMGGAVLSDGGRATAAIATLMAVWWLTEALPLPATALLPIVLFPPLGVTSVKDATAPYASDVVFLFMGGFMLGLAMQRWNLHARLALRIVLLAGTQPKRLIGGFMLATALISMWISNTATAVMMFPVAVSVVEMLRRELGDDVNDREQLRHFAVALMLGVAYSASIGGMGSLIGTPPNVVLASFMAQELGVEISMLDWFAFGVPLMAVLLPLTWWYLVHVAHPARLPATVDSAEFLQKELSALGAMTTAERRVLAVFALAAFAWIFRPQIAAALALPHLSDSGIAVTAAIILFLLPAGHFRGARLMDWETAATLPWGILLLFGGGLSLAAAIGSTGVDQYIAASFSDLANAPRWLLIGAVVVTITLLSELSSNTAVAATFIPVLAAVAAGLGLAPLPILLAATLAASCSFMLPVATPPNAIVFGSGYLRIADMARAGFWTDVASMALITALVTFIA